MSREQMFEQVPEFDEDSARKLTQNSASRVAHRHHSDIDHECIKDCSHSGL